MSVARRIASARIAAAIADDAPLRHSRRVAVMKRLLPAVGVGLLLLIAGWPRLAPLWERVRSTFPAINLRDARELDMIRPRYAGVDRSGHPFVVTADTGRQLPDRTDLMSLTRPHADIKTHSGADLTVTAATGIYQSQAQVLDLFGNVKLRRQDGTTFITQSARVEAEGNGAEGRQPVVGHGPAGNVTAQGFRVLDKGDRIMFTGRSDLLLKSARPVGAKHPPAALPPAVVAVARQTEAAAVPLLAAARHPARAAGRSGRRPTREAHVRARARARR